MADRSAFRGAIGVLAGAVLAAALPAAAATHTVTIENMQFSPAALSVKRGDRVVWVNKDFVPHTATSANAFDSHDIAPSRSWTLVTRKPGRYPYICTLHPAMKAMLTVD